MSKNNLFKVAGLIAAITIFSKFVGFYRDVVIAQAYGATLVSDAYFYAYQIPSLALILLGGLGGPFHTATIAVFSKNISDLTKKPPEDIQRLLSSFVTLTAFVFTILAVLIFIFSDQIISVIASGAEPKLIHLASVQLKIMSPIMVVGGVVGILYGISNVYKEFLFTSLSPTIVSVAVISAIFIFRQDQLGIVLAWGTLIGAIGQLVLQLPVFFKSGFTYRPSFEFFDIKIKKIGEILYPAMIGTTIGQINIYIDMFFASNLAPGAWSAIGYANRIFQFPVGIIITALLVPLFPMFSTFVSKKDWNSLKYYFHQGLSTLWFISFPIFAFIVIYSQDAIKLLFQRGKFDSSAVFMVTEALIFLSISIIPYVARDTLTRIFYAFDDSKTPFFIAIFSIVVKASMNFLFVNHLGIGAITLSTTVVTLVNFLLLAYFIRNKIDLDFKKLVTPTLKIIAVTLITSSIGFGLKACLDAAIPSTFIYLAAKLVVYVIVCIISYFVLSFIFKIKAAQIIVSRVRATILKHTRKEAISAQD